MSLDETEVWSLSKFGYVLYSRRRLAESGAIFDGLVQLRPSNAYCWYGLGLVRREQGDFRGAVESLNEAVKRDPRMWRARVTLAELLRAHGYRDDANNVLSPILQASAPEEAPVRRGQTLWRCWNGA